MRAEVEAIECEEVSVKLKLRDTKERYLRKV